MLGRFSLYDVVAVLIPGVFFLWGIGLIAGPGTFARLVPEGMGDVSAWIVVGYVAGLLLHGLSVWQTEPPLLRRWDGYPSERLMRPAPDGKFSPRQERISTAVHQSFGIDLKRDRKRTQEAFFLCYRALEKLSEYPQVFNAQYGLFLTLLTVFGLLVVAGVIAAIISFVPGHGTLSTGILAILIAGVGVIVCSGRVRQSAESFAQAVYDGFLAHHAAITEAATGKKAV